jgi:iron complex transport system substrate-binding protein
MKKTCIVLIAIVLILIIAGSSYEVYRLNAPSTTTYPKGTVISVVDENGDTVKVTEPVNRIVCLAPDATEIICALGCENKIVAGGYGCTFPPSAAKIPSLGEEYSISTEQILALNPDLVVADAMLNYSAPTVNQLEAAGIPVFLDASTNVNLIPPANETIIDTVCPIVTQLGLILNEQANATKIVNALQSYNNLVADRIAKLTTSEKPAVYFEWYFEWETETAPWVAQAGGIDIVANESIINPTVSPEYVTQANPDVIVDMIQSPDHNVTDFITARDEIMSRPALVGTTAVQDGNVYVIDGTIYEGLTCLQGYLQWAKWLHPSLFEDVNPAAIQEQFLQEFYGSNVTLPGVYSYP